MSNPMIVHFDPRPFTLDLTRFYLGHCGQFDFGAKYSYNDYSESEAFHIFHTDRIGIH